jgi:cyclohexanone monooxygenase
MLYGPNTNNNSLITMLELEVDYIVQHIEQALENSLAWMDVKPAAMAAYNETLQRDIARVTVWSNDCRGYYRAPSGRIVTQCPYTMTMFQAILAEPDVQNYETA